MKLKKGSAQAKAYMAKIRAKKSTAKKTAAKKTTSKKTATKKVGYYGDGKMVSLSDLKPNNVFEWIMGAEYLEVVYIGKINEFSHIKAGTKVGYNPTYLFQFLKGNDYVLMSYPAIREYLRTIPKVGAVKKPMQKMHKDTKSHNVNISVVSGTNDYYIERLQKSVKRLNELERILSIHKSKPLKQRSDLDKTMVKEIPKLIKNEKDLLRMFKKNIK